MSVIPWPYRLLALTALGVALVGFGWIKGASHVQAQWDAAIQQQTLQAAAVRERQAQATVEVVTRYVDRVRVVREKGDTIIKEVPIYVPIQADAACTINRGFVRLHDAAAAGELPEPARDADAVAAGIALSAVAGTVVANYQTCHETAEQLRALQAWVRMVASVKSIRWGQSRATGPNGRALLHSWMVRQPLRARQPEVRRWPVSALRRHRAPSRRRRHWGFGACLGYHEGYRYAHDEPSGYAAGQTYFPEGVARPGWYQPTDRGVERRLGERLTWLRSLDDATPPSPDA